MKIIEINHNFDESCNMKGSWITKPMKWRSEIKQYIWIIALIRKTNDACKIKLRKAFLNQRTIILNLQIHFLFKIFKMILQIITQTKNDAWSSQDEP